jgi:hypothetical protein
MIRWKFSLGDGFLKRWWWYFSGQMTESDKKLINIKRWVDAKNLRVRKCDKRWESVGRKMLETMKKSRAHQLSR